MNLLLYLTCNAAALMICFLAFVNYHKDLCIHLAYVFLFIMLSGPIVNLVCLKSNICISFLEIPQNIF